MLKKEDKKMKYVSTIRRIIKLDEAIARTPYTERYDDIAERLLDKRDMLSRSIKEYAAYSYSTDRAVRRACIIRRKQVKLACTLLGVDYHNIVR